MRRTVRTRIRAWTTDRLIHLALAYGAAPRGRAAIAVLQARGSWHRRLLEAIDACATVADATA